MGRGWRLGVSAGSQMGVSSGMASRGRCVFGAALTLAFACPGVRCQDPVAPGDAAPSLTPSDSQVALYQAMAAIMGLLILLLALVLLIMFRFGVDIRSVFTKVLRYHFVDLILCRLKKEDLHSRKPRATSDANAVEANDRHQYREDEDTFAELPPPRPLIADAGRAAIPTESEWDLSKLTNTSEDEDEEEEEEEEDEDLDSDKKPLQPTPTIPVDEFVQHYGCNTVDQAKLRHEFDMLTTWSKLISKNKNHAMVDRNKPKNRYFDIVPYNYNRVPLFGVDGLRGHQEYKNLSGKDKRKIGYINASYVCEYGSDRAKYIAAQGPLSRTLREFWSMVWQEQCTVIVMLTSLREQGKVKCEQYWPKQLGDSLQFGDIKVTLGVSQCYAFYDYKIMTIEKQDVSRRVHHYLYHHWPDKEAPEMVVPVLDLYHKIFQSDHVTNAPLVIHCSAGVGRTGTFISLDYLLNQAKQTGTVDVMGCVYQLRRQRVSMVQRASQYMFVYEALHEALEAKKTMVTAAAFQDWYKSTSRSVIDKHYQMLRAKCPPLPQEAEGLLAQNQTLNRCQDIIPVDEKRPFLITYMKGRSNYINAVYVDTFLDADSVIVTQCPLQNTVDDLWRLIYDRSCSTVLLLEPSDESYPQFWPEDGEELVCGGIIHVSGGENTRQSTKAVRVKQYSVILSQQPDYVVDVRILQLKTWPRDKTPPNKLDLVELLSLWKKYKRQSSIVICHDGSAKSGLFCACTYVVDQIETDHEVDVYHACRMITASRPSFINSLEQYIFLHDFAEEFLSTFEDYSNFTKAGVPIKPRKKTLSFKKRLSFPLGKPKAVPPMRSDVKRKDSRRNHPLSTTTRHSMPLPRLSLDPPPPPHNRGSFGVMFAGRVPAAAERGSRSGLADPFEDTERDKDVYVEISQQTNNNVSGSHSTLHCRPPQDPGS